MQNEAWREENASGPAVGASLRGMGFTLLVRDIAAEVAFLVETLGFTRIRADADFAILRYDEEPLILHSDQTFGENPLLSLAPESGPRGGGVELRIYDADPDAIWARAEGAGGMAFREPQDRPHGLRECIILSPSGYAWVPGTRSK